jgi:serine/threonine protein kinase
MVSKDDLDRSVNFDSEATSAHATGDPERTRTRQGSSHGSGTIRLNGYELGGEIARGGMGVVLAARDRRLKREVAIKTLLPGASGQVAAVRRFIREARITAKLPHPGIPPIYELGELADGRPFLAMKLIKGRTLAAILAAREQRPSSESCEDLDLTSFDAPGLVQIFAQVCQAVGFAHASGIMHRDLKPANIMVGAFGEVQVMDWGLARSSSCPLEPAFTPSGDPCSATRGGTGDTHFDEPVEIDLSRIGEAMGTPAFMPPEQAQGDWKRVDQRADVFSLGGLLCCILTGKPPYPGTNVLEVVKRARLADLAETFQRLDASAADAELIHITKWCLAPKPSDRPTDAGALSALIEAYRLGVEERLRSAERDRAVLGAKAKEARKRATTEARVRQAVERRAAEQWRLLRLRSEAAAAVLIVVFAAIGCVWWKDRHDLEQRVKASEAELRTVR